MFYISIFLKVFLLSIVATWLTRKLAKKLKLIDYPINERKIHKKETPLFGGFAIFISFFVFIFLSLDFLTYSELSTKNWLGVFIGACFLMLGGFLDDKYNLKPTKQIIWPILAILSVMAGGVGIEKLTNPLGGLIYLNILGYVLTFFWLLGMMYTTKLLDGIDGLVTGVTGIGGFVIFLFTMTTKYYQPDIGLAALIFTAACLGFLFFNWHPAKIFLGEGGSLFLGYILGVLAIISGGKIAIALLVMGIPILDVFWTIARRILQGRNPFVFSDKKHLHHRLLSIGLGQKRTVLIFYFLSLAFGLSALFLQSRGKLMALIVLFFIMLALVVGLNIFNKKHNAQIH